MMIIGIFLVLSLTKLAIAANFDGWYASNSCSGRNHEKPQPLEPGECYTVIKGSIPDPLLSIQASGLPDTNAEGGDYIELYTEGGCQKWKSRIKWSGLCIGVVFRSVRYIVATRENATAEFEAQLTEEEIAAAAELRREEEELVLQLQKIEEDFARTGEGDL